MTTRWCDDSDAPLRVFFHQDMVGAAHDFDTTRKPGWIVEALETSPIPGARIAEAEAATDRRLSRVHTTEYIRAVRSGRPRELAESQGFAWDEGLYRSAVRSAGSVSQAAIAALQDGVAGALATGCHHAAADHGAGFCTFNGLALAALDALDAGARELLILDLDAHCGGGTHSLVGDHPKVTHVDVSISAIDRYEPADANTLDLVIDPHKYLSTIRRRLDELADRDPLDLVIYVAGMDPWEGSAGGLAGVTTRMLEERERLVFDWARSRGAAVAFTPSGGYTRADGDHHPIASMHWMTVQAAATDARRPATGRRRPRVPDPRSMRPVAANDEDD